MNILLGILNKMEIVPLQLKINNSYSELRTYADNNRILYSQL